MNKSAIGKLLMQFNGFAPFRLLNRRKLLVLVYHRFSSTDEFGKTSASAFRRHLDHLVRHYTVISLTEAVQRMANGGNLADREAVITIDDGYQDFFEIAFPILREYKCPATVYAVTGFVEGKCWLWTDKARHILLSTSKSDLDIEIGNERIKKSLNGERSRLAAAGAVNGLLKKLPDKEKDEKLERLAGVMEVVVSKEPTPAFRPFGWEQAREMAAHGIEIGSHTISHPILTNVDPARLDLELKESKRVIQNEIGIENVHFCYPNGSVSPRERDAVMRAGYASAVSTEIDLCSRLSDPFLIPRIDAEPEMYRFLQATSGFDKLKSFGRR